MVEGPVHKAIEAYERWLRIPTVVGPGQRGTRLRARAVYTIGWAFIFIQILNLVGMYHSYGRWILDHTIAVVAIGLVLVAVHCLRWTKAFVGYAIFFSTLALLATLATALPDGTGINSSMLPFLSAGPLLCGFVAGWRSVISYCVAALLLVAFLYAVSLANPLLEPGWNPGRDFQRWAQASFASSCRPWSPRPSAPMPSPHFCSWSGASSRCAAPKPPRTSSCPR